MKNIEGRKCPEGYFLPEYSGWFKKGCPARLEPIIRAERTGNTGVWKTGESAASGFFQQTLVSQSPHETGHTDSVCGLKF